VEIELKPCGDCTACCSGSLIGTAFGNRFNIERPCVFLVEHECTMYNIRPDACRKYQCAWSQGLFPDWMKPLESGVLVSIEVVGYQYLRVMNLSNKPINKRVIEFLDKWTKENNTYYVLEK
jgi:hypothetical protein